MAVEGLSTQPGPCIPNWDSFVGTCCSKCISVLSPGNWIDWVHMSPHDGSALTHIDIDQPGGMIHGPRYHIVPRVIDVEGPNWLFVVFESVGAVRVHKIPNLKRGVPTCSQNVQALWVEFKRTHPISVALSGHDELRLADSPNFPEHIVTACTNDGFLRVNGHWTNCHWVAFLSFSQHCALVVERLHHFCAWSSLLWKWGKLCWSHTLLSRLQCWETLRCFFLWS